MGLLQALYKVNNAYTKMICKGTDRVFTVLSHVVFLLGIFLSLRSELKESKQLSYATEVRSKQEIL
jgi:hypothetical protein